jgi:hypothetical protein
VDFAVPDEDPESTDFLAGATTAQHPQKLQTCLLQFPEATRLDMDLGGYNLGHSKFTPALGDHYTQIDSTMIERLRHKGPRQITDLVLHRYRAHLLYLAVAMPLPSLTRLHIDLNTYACFWNGYYPGIHYDVFDRWSQVAAIWRSVKKVQVCMNVTLSAKEYQGAVWYGTWNFWVS